MYAMLYSFADIQKTLQEPVHDKTLSAATCSEIEKGIAISYGLKNAEYVKVAWI